MENTSDPGKDKPARSSAAYLWLGSISLLLLALTSSIDPSFVYFFLGLSVFFFFLGLRDSVAGKFGEIFQKDDRDDPQPRSYASDSQQRFRQQKQHRQPSPSPVTDGKKTARRAALIFLIVFFSIFAFVFTGVFWSDDAYDGSATSYMAADQFYYSGNYDSALVNYRRAFRARPDYTEALFGYGRTLFDMQQYDSALIMFTKTLEVDPTYLVAAYYRSSVYYNQKKYDEALKEAETIIETNPEYYDAMLVAGDCYYIRNQYEPALEWYQKAYDNEVRNGNLCWIMAYIYEQKGNRDQAISLYRESLSYDSSLVDVYAKLGELLPDPEGNFFRTKAALLRQSN